jgi:predicted transcriptional regulator
MPKAVTAATSTCDVSRRALNLFVLNKLFLLDDSPAKSVIDVAERLVGLHAKRPQTPYLSVYARCSEFTPSVLNKALYHDRQLLRAHCMRGTVHMLPLAQYKTVLSATSGQLDGMYKRAFDEIRNKDYIEKAVLELVRERGPLSHAELAAELKIEAGERDLYLVVNELCTRGILVKATVTGSWRTSVYNYELLDRWQPVIPEGETDTLKSLSRLVQWYLASYGPATLADIAWWIGVSQSQVKKAMAGIDRPLRYEHFKAIGADAYIFEDDRAALEEWRPPDGPQVKFLPGFDQYVMAYADRGRFISPEHYGKVFKRVSGIIEPVVLVDGWIVGTWKYSLVKGKLASDIFERIGDPGVKRALDKAAGQLTDFLVRADAEGPRGDPAEMDE